MIERSFVHVGGQPGAGKTTLIEHLLRGSDGFVSVARCHQDDSLGDFEETRPGGNPELRRYRDAGADDAILYRFPAKHARNDSFFLTEMMEDYSDVVILEGEKPVAYADVSVYVAEPPGHSGSLLVRETRNRAKEEREKLDAMEHWALADGYEGIQWAQVVIVNVRNPGQRGQAEAMLVDLKRLREDEDVFQDILAPVGNRIPITVVAGDLTDPRDPGTRKGLTRVRRSMRGG